MARLALATVLNFFLPGAGNLVLARHVVPGLFWIVGACGLTYVELTLQAEGSAMYWPMFGAVLVLNTGIAWWTFVEGRSAATKSG